MSSKVDKVERHSHPPDPVVGGGLSGADVVDDISAHVLTDRLGQIWWVALGCSLLLLTVFAISVAVLLWKGVGVWGIHDTVGWGLAITNFVWWIGIGHAGTFISAFLLLMSQGWRTSINRFAEGMTLLAVACAGVFPLLHLGRPWLFYWLMPYPNRMALWPQWRSPLIWDFVAVSTYGSVSLLFWYLGLVPDLAAVRDRATGRKKKVYALLCLGWRGSAYHWSYHQRAYLILAALATPLVVSVHSIVSLDFSVAILPGWHSTIFPPYFVAGAILSGFAMVITLAVPLRAWMKLENYITLKHLENSAKLMLITSFIVTYGYASEIFFGWWSGEVFHMAHLKHLFTGAYSPLWFVVLLCNSILPQLLWWRKFRASPWALFWLSLAVNVGMWGERYIIVVGTLYKDYLPSAWRLYHATIWDWGLFLGTFGLFGSLFLLFIRYVPVISIHEMVELIKEDKE
ncbi:MAG TPA: hydrogenase [Phycisphaerales bacterium]|nr:hydrogenase [Phycisphaerales bacterium]